MSALLGLDLGGTSVQWVVVDAEGSVAGSGVVASRAGEGPDAVVGVLVETGRQAIAAHGPVTAAGLGVPGLFDFGTGEVVFFTNLPGPWEGVPLRSMLADGLGVPVTLINDARAFTLAEARVGVGRGCRTVACLTLGTGVGGGLVIDGRLHFGAFGIGGELGHQTVQPGGPVCGCGNPGCMEALARGPAVAAAAGVASFEEVIAGVEAGDPRCTAALDGAIEALAVGLANVVTTVGPERIVLGGGMMAAGDLLLEPLRSAVRRKVTLVPPELVSIVAASLGPIAGAVGAALAALGSPAGDAAFLMGEIPSAVRRRTRDPRPPRAT